METRYTKYSDEQIPRKNLSWDDYSLVVSGLKEEVKAYNTVTSPDRQIPREEILCNLHNEGAKAATNTLESKIQKTDLEKYLELLLSCKRFILEITVKLSGFANSPLTSTPDEFQPQDWLARFNLLEKYLHKILMNIGAINMNAPKLLVDYFHGETPAKPQEPLDLKNLPLDYVLTEKLPTVLKVLNDTIKYMESKIAEEKKSPLKLACEKIVKSIKTALNTNLV